VGRSGSSNCCCRLLLEECIVCADFSYIAGHKGLFFGAEWCIKVHRRAWHHSINRNGPRPRIIVLERRGDSRPLRGQKEEKKGTPKKKISNRSGWLLLGLFLSLHRPTGLFLTNPVCTAVLWRRNTVSPGCQFSPLSAPSGATNQYHLLPLPTSYHPIQPSSKGQATTTEEEALTNKDNE
jgi:hypothetical protein